MAKIKIKNLKFINKMTKISNKQLFGATETKKMKGSLYRENKMKQKKLVLHIILAKTFIQVLFTA